MQVEPGLPKQPVLAGLSAEQARNAQQSYAPGTGVDAGIADDGYVRIAAAEHADLVPEFTQVQCDVAGKLGAAPAFGIVVLLAEEDP